jgi:hypothetical protein
MMIVGQVSSPEEATEVEFIVQSLVIANRIKTLTQNLRMN